MRVLLNGQPYNGGSSGFPSLDAASDQWKSNAGDMLNHLFGLPKQWLDADQDGTMTRELADATIAVLGSVAHKVGLFLLHISPSVMLIVCLATILGGMIGSTRCRHWAGVSGLATLILGVVVKYVGA